MIGRTTTRLNLRALPSTSSHVLSVLPTGAAVSIIETVGGWHRVALWTDTATNATASAWVYAQYVETRTPEPPPQQIEPAARILGIHQLADKQRAIDAIRIGAKAVMVFEDATLAQQLSLAHPDVLVMHRKYFEWAPAPRDMIAQHGIDPDRTGQQSRVWYRGINEFPSSPEFHAEPDGILRRAAWDIECARILKRAAPDAVWVAGGWSHGTPDFTRADVCEAVRKGYADAYNSGLIAYDIHNYSKAGPGGPRDYAHYGPIWFERRWEFLFQNCGFDPRVRRIVSSESGGELGAGGFRWADYSADEFRSWALRYLDIQRTPLIVNGREYPSPFIASTLYQWGDNHNGAGGWWGYGLDPYIGVLEELYRS